MKNLDHILNILKNGTDHELKEIFEYLLTFDYSDHFFEKFKENYELFSDEGKKVILRLIEKWKSSETVPYIIDLYNTSKDFNNKIFLIKILNSLPIKHNCENLSETLKKEKSYELKIRLLNLFGNSRLTEFYDIVIEYLNNDDIELRAASLKNAVNIDYRKTFSLLINIFDKDNDKEILDILSVLSVINSKELQIEISDFLINQAAKFNKKPLLFLRFVKTLLNFNNFKVLKIMQNMLSRKMLLNEIEELISELKKYEYNEKIEKFYFFLLEHAPQNIINKLPEIILTCISKKEDAKKYTDFIHSKNRTVINIAIKLIIRFSLLEKDMDNILITRLKEEQNKEFFSDIFVALCSTNTNNNKKLIDLANFFKKLPDDIKLKIIINFRKLPENFFATSFLYFLYNNQENSEKIRATIASIMGITGTDRSIKFLTEILKDENSRVRANAVESLEMCIKNSELVINLLFPLLQDRNNRVKANVAITLWQHGGLRMLGMLEKMLLEHEDKWHRASAAYALSIIKNSKSMDSILKALNNDPDEHVKANCIRAIGQIGDTNCFELLKEYYFKSASRFIKLKTLEAMGNLNNNSAVKILFNEICSEDEEISNIAYNTLKNRNKINNDILKDVFLKYMDNELYFDKIMDIIAKTASYSFIDFLKENRKKINSKSIINNINIAIKKIKHRNEEEKSYV